jgi:ribosome-associated heat shock protein Hsp15
MSGLRIDKWLWFARFCKSRSLAQSWIEAGEVRLNGQRVEKCSDLVKPGDRIEMPRGLRLRHEVEVLGLADKRGGAPEAQGLYRSLSITKDSLF